MFPADLVRQLFSSLELRDARSAPPPSSRQRSLMLAGLSLCRVSHTSPREGGQLARSENRSIHLSSQWKVPMIIKKTRFPDASGNRKTRYPDASGYRQNMVP